eukprot:m.185916 g.185916  ORF g.185916 m.185916 type:complete len:443 (-) comp16603_c0_seq1:440-1768(-)
MPRIVGRGRRSQHLDLRAHGRRGPERALDVDTRCPNGANPRRVVRPRWRAHKFASGKRLAGRRAPKGRCRLCAHSVWVLQGGRARIPRFGVVARGAWTHRALARKACSGLVERLALLQHLAIHTLLHPEVDGSPWVGICSGRGHFQSRLDHPFNARACSRRAKKLLALGHLGGSKHGRMLSDIVRIGGGCLRGCRFPTWSAFTGTAQRFSDRDGTNGVVVGPWCRHVGFALGREEVSACRSLGKVGGGGGRKGIQSYLPVTRRSNIACSNFCGCFDKHAGLLILFVAVHLPSCWDGCCGMHSTLCNQLQRPCFRCPLLAHGDIVWFHKGSVNVVRCWVWSVLNRVDKPSTSVQHGRTSWRRDGRVVLDDAVLSRFGCWPRRLFIAIQRILIPRCLRSKGRSTIHNTHGTWWRRYAIVASRRNRWRRMVRCEVKLPLSASEHR